LTGTELAKVLDRNEVNGAVITTERRAALASAA
jgi:hypothetical protein